ncbi:MAG TPA: hypothetical protein VIH06_17650 [Ilumatobacteraceae bacterium]
MREPEPLTGLRVVAAPAAIDAAMLPTGATVLRIATDDVFVTGVSSLTIDDPFAIIEPEFTFVQWQLTTAEFADVVNHIEWALPARGTLGQGLIAGVPAKIVISDDHVMLIVSAGLAHELSARLW